MLHLISTAVLVLIGFGLANRRRPGLHWKIMATAFAIDLAMVLTSKARGRRCEPWRPEASL